EYNIWVDPDAARLVFLSGLPVELVGWHLCRGEAVLDQTNIDHVLQLNTEIARFAVDSNSHARHAYKVQTGEDGICLPDPVAMCLALDSSVGTDWGSHYVNVETKTDLSRGLTVVDRLNVADDERNRDAWSDVLRAGNKVKVCWTIDNARWKQALYG